MEQTIKNYIAAIETNIERYKIKNDYKAVQAAENMIVNLQKMLEQE